MTTEPDRPRGHEVTDEEWKQIQALRPKHALTGPEIDTLLEVIAWFKEMIKRTEVKQKAREARTKFYPIIFGAIGATSAIVGVVITLSHLK